MSRHNIPPTDLDDARTVWIQPDPDPKAERGGRLRLDKERGELAMLVDERVLPEKVDHPNANRIIEKRARIWLTRSNAAWLHEALGEMLALGDDW